MVLRRQIEGFALPSWSWPIPGLQRRSKAGVEVRTSSVCIVPAFTARDGGRPINIHSYRSPLAVTNLIYRSIGEAVNSSEICHHALVSASQILEAVHFVEDAT